MRRKLQKQKKQTIFDFLVRSWDNTSDILISVIVASLLINILTLAFPLTLLQIYDRIIPNHAIQTLTLLIIGLSIALVLEAILRVLRSYISAWADAKFEHRMSCRSFEHVIKSTLSAYERSGSGAHLERLNALSSLRDFYASQAITVLIDIPFIFIFLAVIAYIGGWLVLVPAITLLLFIPSSLILNKNIKSLLQIRRTHEDHRLNFIIEVLKGIHTIKSSTMEAQMLRRYERLQSMSAIHNRSLSVNDSYAKTLGILISQLSMVFIVAFGCVFVLQESLTVGALAACTLLTGRCIQPVNRAVSVWWRLQSIEIAQEKLQEVFTLPLESDEALPEIPKIEGHIHLENIIYRYNESQAHLFHHLNLTVSPGENIAITGDTHSGKSTLLWIIMGLLRPQHGHVYIDQQDISQFQTTSLSKQIAYLPQHTELFNGSIMDNLTLFQEEHVESALKVAERIGIAEVIERLPHGYNTKVANQAMESLPFGIIQRIAIARALVTDPPIILFDGAETGLDQTGDTALRKLMEEITSDTSKTVVIVSHRPSLLDLANKRYHLSDGKLRVMS